MSALKPGTLCITVGPSGENDGCIVRVLTYVGQHRHSPCITEGYEILTVSGRPFKSTSNFSGGDWTVVRNVALTCTVDRRNLRPLVELDAECKVGEEVVTPAAKTKKKAQSHKVLDSAVIV